MYAFFQEHLNLPGSKEEEEVEYLTEKELQTTTTGQISTSVKDAETVFTLNEKEAEKRSARYSKLEKNRNNICKT